MVQVELEEGPRLTARLVGADNSVLKVGLPVQVAFERIDDELTMPCFKPA